MGGHAVRDLRELLNDPQPGLRAWHLALMGAMSDFGFVSEARLQKVEAQLNELAAALEAVEWCGDTVQCPWCGMSPDLNEAHAPDCQRQSALASLKAPA